MCKGSRYLRLRLDADQIDSLNAFLERAKKYDSVEMVRKGRFATVIEAGSTYIATYKTQPIREMAAYWQGVFQQAIERSDLYLTPQLKGDS